VQLGRKFEDIKELKKDVVNSRMDKTMDKKTKTTQRTIYSLISSNFLPSCTECD
jgi:hypothetical protein